MNNNVRGEYFPLISDKILSYYGQELCNIHDIKNGDIVYCDTHSILNYKDILNQKKDLIIITHNSDHYICDGKPWNGSGISVDEFYCYRKWYAQNSYSIKKEVIPIPIGLENVRWESSFGPKRKWMEQVMNEDINPDLMVYFNCNKSTNIGEREKCFNVSKNIEFITIDEPNLSYIEYLRKIKKHKYTLSPRGNGLDCHRTWEVLMMKRVPILKREGELERLYKDIPILFIDDWNDIYNIDFEETYNKFSFDNQSYLEFEFWKRKI